MLSVEYYQFYIVCDVLWDACEVYSCPVYYCESSRVHYGMYGVNLLCTKCTSVYDYTRGHVGRLA